MKKGEVWWVLFPPPSATVRGIPTEVPLGPEDGVSRTCVANADTTTTVHMSIVRDYLCSLEAPKVEALERAIKSALDLP